MRRGEPRGRCVLPALSPEAAAAVLAPPRLPADATRQVPLVRDAARLGVPIALVVPASGPRLLLARALHAIAERPGPLIAVTGARPRLRRIPAGATLVVDLDTLSPSARLVLDAILDDGVVWVLATTAADPPPRLSTVALRVPPLDDRRDELPALAASALATLAARRGGGGPSFTDAALETLAARGWPGDQAELEAVVARALLRAGDAAVVDVEHLELAASPVAPATEPPAEERAHLELLLAEMAHELKNPLVTIKTFADHLPALLEDAELRRRFATLSGEAIARMDGLLENVLEFAHLDSPQPRPLEVGALLDRLLADVEPELRARSVTVRRAGETSARCAADPEHVAYALRNLIAGVVREIPPREDLVLDASANGVVRVGFATGGAAASRLRQLAAPDGAHALNDPTLLPLPFTLARAVIERNGGTLGVVPETDGRTTLVVRLPVADPESHGG
jgi:signal transduction histidine kinase